MSSASPVAGSRSRRQIVLLALLAGLARGCGGEGGLVSSERRNDLAAMDTARILIKGQPIEVWLAREPDELRTGLMNVTQDELAPFTESDGNGEPVQIERGMLFVFDAERPLAFWMLNTIVPLDIAYILGDGRIVKTYTMAPLETRTYPSLEPARFALEVRAGLFEELGIGPDDHVEIPESVLKRTD